MASSDHDSSQFLALQHFTCELSVVISADLIRIAEKLFAKKVISQYQLQKALLSPRVPSARASELVTQVIAQVRSNPEKFDIFLRALEGSDVSHKVVRDVREKYHENQSIEVSCPNCIYAWSRIISGTCSLWKMVGLGYHVLHVGIGTLLVSMATLNVTLRNLAVGIAAQFSGPHFLLAI